MSIIEKLLCERGYYNMRHLTKISAVASKRAATFRRLAVIKQEANKCVANHTGGNDLMHRDQHEGSVDPLPEDRISAH